MLTYLRTLPHKLHTAYSRTTVLREDAPVLQFLASLPQKSTRYLEVGAGMGRFVLLLQRSMPWLHITCVELNKQLTGSLEAAGLHIMIGDITKLTIPEETYDIVHCSHVIEHLGYPAITHALDTMANSLKKGGYLIIRSPLLYPGFYKEIDHIRPYPPESIFNYFNNPQQQKIGTCQLQEVTRWYRREALHTSLFEGTRLHFYSNLVLKTLWMWFNFPRSQRTGYILILQKK